MYSTRALTHYAAACTGSLPIPPRTLSRLWALLVRHALAMVIQGTVTQIALQAFKKKKIILIKLRLHELN